MKVIEDGRREKKRFPAQVRCPECFSLIEYGEDDINTGAFGIAKIKCPVCSAQIDLDDEDLDKRITTLNMSFPTDFFHFGDGAYVVSDEKIEKEIRELIKRMHDTKNNDYAFSGTGDTLIITYRYYETDKPEAYGAVVCKNYWELEDIEYKGERDV